jgi:catechol 2,3-dioxygenase-like lactoylglutathione lyase family enzyme
MITRLYRVILPVSDIERAAEFYGLMLGHRGERVSPGRHYFDCGGTILACYDPAADGDPVGEGWRFHENQYVYFASAIWKRFSSAPGRPAASTSTTRLAKCRGGNGCSTPTTLLGIRFVS